MLRVRVVSAAAKVNKAVMQAAGNFGLREGFCDAFGLCVRRIELGAIF